MHAARNDVRFSSPPPPFFRRKQKVIIFDENVRFSGIIKWSTLEVLEMTK